MKSIIKKGMFAAVIALGVFGAGMAYAGWTLEDTLHASAASTSIIKVPFDTTPEKIEDLKKDLVHRLLLCESAGHKEDDAIIIYDNNTGGTLKGKNVWSIGQLQFKVSTIQKYHKDRTGDALTQKEAVLVALDTDRASDLALWIIFETTGGIYNWENCSNKLHLAEEVTIIKKLSK